MFTTRRENFANGLNVENVHNTYAGRIEKKIALKKRRSLSPRVFSPLSHSEHNFCGYHLSPATLALVYVYTFYSETLSNHLMYALLRSASQADTSEQGIGSPIRARASVCTGEVAPGAE